MVAVFCGHSHLTGTQAEMEIFLEKTIEALAQEGVEEFWSGGYGDFDRLAARTVWRMKERFPRIKSVLVLAYLNRGEPDYFYDETLYPPLETVPKRLAIIRRNEYMVERADVVVSGVTRSFGGAFYTHSYALGKKKRMVSFRDFKRTCPDMPYG